MKRFILYLVLVSGFITINERGTFRSRQNIFGGRTYYGQNFHPVRGLPNRWGGQHFSNGQSYYQNNGYRVYYRRY